MSRLHRVVPHIAVALLAASARASDPPFFTGIGDLPGGIRRSGAYDVSADGSVVCGFGTADTGLACRWTLSLGLEALGDLPGGGAESGANAISADGLTIVGFASSANGEEAFAWTAAGGMVGLGDLPGGSYLSSATAVSSDGRAIVGYSASAASTPLSEAFRWTATGGIQPLGDLAGASFYSFATGISDDGTRISGFGTSTASGSSGSEAALWALPQGLKGLGDLPGGAFSSAGSDISGDGRYVVGSATAVSGPLAFRWDDPLAGGAGMGSLGDLPGGIDDSSARAVSYDGRVVVGEGVGAPGILEVFVWTESTGCVSLHDVLAGFGLDFTGWTMMTVTDSSADGRTIVGWGIDPDGNQEGWVAYLGDAWTDLGQGLPGVAGVPVLDVHGSLLSGHPLTVALTGAKPSGSATLVVGLSELDASFKGGTLVPNPDVLMPGLVLDGDGALSLDAAWPPGVPSGLSLWLQAWIADAAAVQGFAASNAELGVAP
jgi:probable HAF family extracellular repeat protein